jgi:hypothetical protein
MGKNISLFSGYSKTENRTTNYCLLLLKMIYEFNPIIFSEVLATLTNENVGKLVGVNFIQQEKKKSGVPDGLITQHSFSIFIETKNCDWFYDNQLKRHLESLNEEHFNTKILLAISNFEQSKYRDFDKIKDICEKKYNNKIYFNALSFEEFLSSLKRLDLPKYLIDAINDFENYLNEQNLLPTWEYYLDVVNCADTLDEIQNKNIYVCPTSGGAYSHSRCKYFGIYKNKTVSKIALIEAVVDIEDTSNQRIKWKNIYDTDDKKLIKKALSKAIIVKPNEYPVRVFLLGELYDTNFIKDTIGGMQWSKMYFDIKKLNVFSALELAEKLNGKTWSNY